MENDKKDTPIKEAFIDNDSTRPANDLAMHYWSTLRYFMNLIKASELKAGLILSFYGILLNFVYQNAERTMALFTGNMVFYILVSVWFLLTLLSIFFSIRSFIPRIETNYDTNAFFFGDIISKFGTINEYSKALFEISINDRERYDHLGQQVYINAKIAATKFKYVNKSLRFLAYSLVVLLVIVAVYLIYVIFL